MSLDDLKTHDELMLEGAQAAQRGDRLDDNPYDIGDLDWVAWREGYHSVAE